MNGHLVKEFLPQEVHRALKQIFPLKTPSLDGMPPLFYQHFWPTMGNVVTKTVLDFLIFGISPPNFNDTYIILVPKINQPKRVTEFRPISLCNVIYKLAVKHLLMG